MFVYSAGQLPDLRLDQPSRRGGKLVHPADGSQILPVDSTGVGNVGVLPHKDGGHPDTLPPQGPNLVRRVLHAYLTVIVPAEGGALSETLHNFPGEISDRILTHVSGFAIMCP